MYFRECCLQRCIVYLCALFACVAQMQVRLPRRLLARRSFTLTPSSRPVSPVKAELHCRTQPPYAGPRLLTDESADCRRTEVTHNSSPPRWHNNERVALEDGNQVFIGDILLNASNPNYENVKAIRIIGALEVEGGVHAIFRLKLPKELSKNTTDSSKWEVDDRYIEPNSYFHICAETIFYSDAVALSRDAKASVLLLGLGGGVVDSFLHHHFPKLNITVIEISSRMAYVASKWFGLKLDNYHSLVIADGVSFIEEEVKKGRTYDALFLDACYSDFKHKILCPTDDFLGKKIIDSMSRLMSYDGILVVNAAPGSMSIEEEREVLTEHFSEFFRHCGWRNATGINEVLYCMNRPPDIGKHVNLFEYLGFPTPTPLK